MSTQTRKSSTPTVTYTTTIDVGTFDQIEFLFTYRIDGTGTAKDQQYDEDEVAFTWDTSILDGADQELGDILSDHAHTVFWDEINDQLDDRVLAKDDYGGEELVFESGTNEELERIVRLSLYAFPAIWGDARDSIDVVLRARTEGDSARVDEYCELMEDGDISQEIKTYLVALIDLALQWIDPYGWSLEYNDGAYGRSSGYSESAGTVDFTISRPSFHELAEARGELLRTFAAHDLEEDAKVLLPEEGD